MKTPARFAVDQTLRRGTEPTGRRLPRRGRPGSQSPLAGFQHSRGNQAVLRMLDRPGAGMIRRCSDGMECGPCAQERLGLQRDATGAAPAQGVPASVEQTLREPGQPLAPATRAMFEPHFQYDFGNVRIHTGALANASARAVSARAYTVGGHIVFGVGTYAPAGHEGRRLLAHELAHVVQQRGSAVGAPRQVGLADDPAEKEAQVAANSITEAEDPAPSRARLGAAPDGRLARQEVTEEESGAVAAKEPETGEVSDGDVPVVGVSEESEQPVLMAELDLPGPSGAAEPLQAPGKTSGAKKPPVKRWITKIDVDLSAQELTVTWSDGATEGPSSISSGKGLPNTKEDPCKTQTETNCTPVGSFTAGRKGNAKTTNKEGDAMAWYLGFVDDRGIGIHDSQPVAKGTPLSHGCVRVGDGAAAEAFAKKLNTNSRAGQTVINVSGKAPTKAWKKAVSRPKKKAAKPKR